MRRLVVSFHATVANYEYLVYWRFYQDGNIECEVRATGIMVTTQFEGEQPPYGTLVDERTYAPFHQHFLVARLDLDVDGEANTVYATDSEALPTGPDNPYGLAMVQRSTPLRTEDEGKQDYDWHRQRAWKVVNDRRARTRSARRPATSSSPAARCPPLIDPASPVFERAQVDRPHAVGDARTHEDERWPCGEMPTQSASDTGLPVWTQREPPDRGHRRRPLVRLRRSTTSRARRSGRSCRSTPSRSGSSRSGSSTATRRSTSRRRTGMAGTPSDEQILAAVAAEGEAEMEALLADLVARAPRCSAPRRDGQDVMRRAFAGLGLEPVDVPLDPAALRASPAASPFSWDVAGKANVLAHWPPGRRAAAAR